MLEDANESKNNIETNSEQSVSQDNGTGTPHQENNTPSAEDTTQEATEAATPEAVLPDESTPIKPEEKPAGKFDALNQKVMEIRKELRKVIVGQDEMIELLITCILTGGHVLLEGVPGIAKTLSAKLLSDSMDVNFSRIQFTPDLMPTDVVGTNVFNLKQSEFEFKTGPVFSNIVLIDEINRAPAKTQSALFEVMEEKQVTIDGKTHSMSLPFFVIATQNPIEQEGTYRLPEAQLDRFLFRIKINYPQLQDEKNILHKFKNDMFGKQKNDVNAVINAKELLDLQQQIESVYIKDSLVDYIAEIVNETRNNGSLYLGASPRASLAILNSSKVTAAIAGRDFVTPDDIRKVTYPVLNHRILLTPDKEMEGVEVEDVIHEILEKIEIPR